MKRLLTAILFSLLASPAWAGTIFYHTDRGSPDARPIYGVHPDSNISVPSNVRSIVVLETPDKIAWPVPAGQTQGKEQWTVVDTTTTPPSLKLNSNIAIPVDPDMEIKTAIEAATTLQELKDALTGKTRAGQVKGRSVK